MKSLKLSFLLVMLLALAGSGFAQSGFSGRVVEVLDGKTVVVELHTRSRITAQLQFIEVPEPEQSMHELVIDHLKKLVLGKHVSFKPRGITTEKSIVQLFSNGVDISQQMIRDGAAWHAVLESGSQDADERIIYQNTEKQAREEKRGVWSKEDMLPAWEFRAALEEQKKLDERARLEAIKAKNREDAKQKMPKLPTRSTLALDFNSGLWGNIIDPAADASLASPTQNGLFTGKIPSQRLGYLATPPNLVKLSGKDAPDKLQILTYYVYKEFEDPDPTAYFVVVISESDKWAFEKENNSIILLESRMLSLGNAFRLYRENGEKVQELLLYKVDRDTLQKIAKAKNVNVKIGGFSGKPGDGLQDSLKTLLETTTN